MHVWGEEGVDWKGIDDAASYIALNLRRWGRIQVTDYKEKWGTVRVYCHFGCEALFWFVYPGWVYYQWPDWVAKIDRSDISHFLWRAFERILVPYQVYVYKAVYNKAVKRWPHLRQEILTDCDYPDLVMSKEVQREYGWIDSDS